LKKKHPEHVNLERWLVSYADFITLLFAFFVVMYSIANQDRAKVKQITEAIEKAFRGHSTMLDVGSGQQVNAFSNPTSEWGQVIDTTVGRTNARPEFTPELSQIAKKIEESLAYQLQTTDLKETVRFVHDDRGLVIRFSANKLFRPGQDSVEKIANELSEVGNRMSGHPYRPDLVDLIERLRALKPEQHKIVMCMRKLQLHNGRNVEAWRAIVDGYEREAECDDKYRVLSDALRGYGIEVEEQ